RASDLVKERSHSVDTVSSVNCELGYAGSLTRQVAVEWFLSRVAAHMGLESVAASVRETLAGAALPLARVLFLPVLDVRVVDVLDELVHVALVAGRAAVPVADGHLVLEVLLVEARVDGRAGDVARRVRRHVRHALEGVGLGDRLGLGVVDDGRRGRGARPD